MCENLKEYLKKHPPTGKFEPHAWYDADGNQIEVYWGDQPDYGVDTPNHKMCIMKSQETDEPVGVIVYGARQLFTKLLRADPPRDDPNYHTTRELADLLGTVTWRVRRLFEDGTLPEPPRFAGKRAIPGEWIPKIVDALRDRDWLPEAEKPVAAARAAIAKAEGAKS